MAMRYDEFDFRFELAVSNPNCKKYTRLTCLSTSLPDIPYFALCFPFRYIHMGSFALFSWYIYMGLFPSLHGVRLQTMHDARRRSTP